MRSVRRTAAAIVVAVLTATAALSGCAPGSTGDKAALKVGWVVDPCWAQVPVARDLGYFTDAGVDVEIIPFPTGAAALEALAGGAVDVATGGDVPTSAAAIKNPNLRIIADGSRWPEGRFVARRSAGISSIPDLAGRQVAVPLGSSAHFFAAKFLSDAGVTAELVQTGPAEIVTAISNRSVDAAAVFQPPLAKAVAALGDDAVELQGSEKYNQHSLYLATLNAIETKPTQLTAFLTAVRRADQPLADADQSALTAVAAATGLDEALITQVADEFVYRTEIGPELADDLTDRAQWAQSIGRVPADAVIPDYQSLIVPGFLDGARDE
ncbi:hypothetical protein BST23_23530 [Mycolicibacterium elephantis]|uniref:Solute-binding protein family 3/N-terminal domain-containing protein n=1 Tax=Mycolicibacterium elephantis TaxID=81858 RepID=A0A0M2ZG13_9MYCO|nr:hypothetical protein AAV95_18680 [Mycolicibacterium elephantis]OBB26356.1 hypothetical protein A5762_08805 [Mycolicibacterium elephantis]OBE97882.1 hypothetical protein A5776_15925 [Mycolicibacterium elephantis]ORA60127.1 hypothetical protein BST23_23530 [Mycolicibacterium elephantis]